MFIHSSSSNHPGGGNKCLFKSNAEGREGRQILVDMPRMMPDYGQNMQPGFSVAARALEHGWRVGRRLQSRDQVSPGKEWSSGVSSSVSSSHTPHLPGVTHQDSLYRGVLSSFLQVLHLKHENARIISKHRCQDVVGHCEHSAPSEMSAILVTMRNQCQ